MTTYKVLVRERIGNEYWVSEYTGEEHNNYEEALKELNVARDDFAIDLFADAFIREVIS